MNVKEYIEGAKRTEPKTYDAYMKIANQNPDLILSILLMLTAQGYAADKFKKALIYGKTLTDKDGCVIPLQDAADSTDDVWDEFVEDSLDKAVEKIETSVEDREAALKSFEDRVKEPRIARLIHSAVGAITEQAEILQAVSNYIIDPKLADLDMVNIREEIGDTLWYGAIQLDVTDTDLEATAIQNNQKLRLRFPEKFTEDLAINRDVDAERALLEKS